MGSNSKIITVLIVCITLCCAGLVLSGVALYEHVVYTHGLASGPSFCNISQRINCEAVNASAWSTFLGVPIASYGVFFYGTLAALLIVAVVGKRVDREAVLAVALLGSVIATTLSVVLFGISEFIIGALCILCIGLYLVNAALLVVLWRGAFIRNVRRGSAQGLGALLRFAREAIPVGGSSWAATVYALVLLGFAGFSAYLPRVIYNAAAARSISAPESRGMPKEEADPVEQWKAQPSIEIVSKSGGGAFGDYSKGIATAPVQIVEFADFECPGCRRMYVALREMLKQFEGQYQLTFRNYPLDQACNPGIPEEFHRLACLAAYFTRCAGEQGRFWEAVDFAFTDPIFESESSVSDVRDFLMSRGSESLSLDKEAMSECLSSDRYLAKIQSDIQEGDRIGLAATPSIWINGKFIEHPTIAGLERIIGTILQGK